MNSPALDQAIAERMNELRVPHNDVVRQMDTNPGLRINMQHWFKGKAIMVWDSQRGVMSFKKAKK